MNCPECLEQVQTLLDGERIDRAELAGHLAGCATCRETFAVAEQLREGLGSASLSAPPTDFAVRVRAAWLRRRTWIRRVQYGSMAAAAAILVGVAVWSIAWMWKPPVHIANEQPDPVRTEPKAPIASNVAKPVNGVGQRFLSFGNQFTSSISKQAKPLMARLPDAKLPIPKHILPVTQVGRAVTNGLEPVFDSASGVVQVILRSLPLEDGESKDK